jgi:hypothetical protein
VNHQDVLGIQGDALWLSVGYHWAWNVLQTAIFGTPGSAPSLQPLQVQGSGRWMGRPGHPESELLNTLTHLAIALLLWLWMRRSNAQRGPKSVT